MFLKPRSVPCCSSYLCPLYLLIKGTELALDASFAHKHRYHLLFNCIWIFQAPLLTLLSKSYLLQYAYNALVQLSDDTLPRKIVMRCTGTLISPRDGKAPKP